MKFQLISDRRRLFGGRTLTLVATERGWLQRKRVTSRAVFGDPILLLEQAELAAGDIVKWRVTGHMNTQPGRLIESDDLPDLPGPIDVPWRAIPLI